MAKQPIDFMFSPYRRQVLATLFLHPDEQFHVRELARLTKVSAGSLHRELTAMADAGLLLREKLGNQVFYQANAGSPIYEELGAIFRKTMGLVQVLQAALEGIADSIDIAFVFGSLASGRQSAGSDLDICVLGDVSMLEVVKALDSARETLRREINPVVMTTRKFSSLSKRKDRFVVRVLSEPKLFIAANQDELAKLVKDRATRQA
ncbi:MAG: nucleotidyltransferase domain-containing protein [Gammaproteobacteria bacterium]|nr:nucleotidyltransferase domain-containing protein [Gammaproteobacteria bacterium]MDH5323700.1 nucleotidyltransferase domain-containing protein [Gammaproteobacteria bacterium]